MGCRYDDQIAIWGRDYQEALMNKKVFMVGAGALGCELRLLRELLRKLLVVINVSMKRRVHTRKRGHAEWIQFHKAVLEPA